MKGNFFQARQIDLVKRLNLEKVKINNSPIELNELADWYSNHPRENYYSTLFIVSSVIPSVNELQANSRLVFRGYDLGLKHVTKLTEKLNIYEPMYFDIYRDPLTGLIFHEEVILNERNPIDDGNDSGNTGGGNNNGNDDPDIPDDDPIDEIEGDFEPNDFHGYPINFNQDYVSTVESTGDVLDKYFFSVGHNEPIVIRLDSTAAADYDLYLIPASNGFPAGDIIDYSENPRGYGEIIQRTPFFLDPGDYEAVVVPYDAETKGEIYVFRVSNFS